MMEHAGNPCIMMVCSPVWIQIYHIFLSRFAILMLSSSDLLEKQKNNNFFPLLYSMCCCYLISLRLFPLIHFLTHASESCLLACFCSCKYQRGIFSNIKHSYGKMEEAYATCSHSCINGTSAIYILSIKETGCTSYIFVQIHRLLNSQDFKVTVNMD